jgi:hypothetical protein
MVAGEVIRMVSGSLPPVGGWKSAASRSSRTSPEVVQSRLVKGGGAMPNQEEKHRAAYDVPRYAPRHINRSMETRYRTRE